MRNGSKKIGFFEAEGWEKKILLKIFEPRCLYFADYPLTDRKKPECTDFDALVIFVGSAINKKTLEFFPNLKFITTRSTGYDHIDLKECERRGIRVSYVPGYGDNTVAEFAFGLILNLTRKIHEAVERVKQTGKFSYQNLRGIDLKGKILGVIGTGRIGKEVIKIGSGFGMRIVAYDPFPDKQFARAYGYRYLSLRELLKQSDVITIHSPYTTKTHHLINLDNLRYIKKGAYLVNTARGPIVSTDALVKALEKGILAGVGLDVLEEEEYLKSDPKYTGMRSLREKELLAILQYHILMTMPNVLITPHNAFNTQEALERILDTTIANLQGFLKNRPTNLVPLK